MDTKTGDYSLHIQVASTRGHRHKMEDSTVFYKDNRAGGVHVCGVCDGHGTAKISAWLASNLGQCIVNAIVSDSRDHPIAASSPGGAAAVPNTVPDAIRAGFAIAERRLEEEEDRFTVQNSGSTACIAVFLDAFGVFYVANCGDSRAVNILTRASITIDHRPESAQESARIHLTTGGTIVNGKLNGELAMSRAFGDAALRNVGLTERPDVYGPFSTRNADILIACDGVFDVLDDVRVADTVKLAESRGDNAADALLHDALNAGSTDNITVIRILQRQ